MEYIGRITELMLCIICLTLAPAGHMLQSCKEQEQNRLSVAAEMLCSKIRQRGSLVRAEYEQFCSLLKQYPAYDYELMIAKKYVTPFREACGDAEADNAYMPLKIFCRTDIEEMLAAKEEILLEGTVYINIAVYGEESFFYTCGGEVKGRQGKETGDDGKNGAMDGFACGCLSDVFIPGGKHSCNAARQAL